jgi:hypothetical protein
METAAFWREREARFLAVAEPRLHAILSDADIDDLLSQANERLQDALRAADHPIDDLQTRASAAGHFAGLKLRQAYICRWNISGAFDDRDASRVVLYRFRYEAAWSARGANLVAIGRSDDEAVDLWLDALVAHESPYCRDECWIEHLAAASAALCAKLAARAYDTERTGSAIAVNAPEEWRTTQDTELERTTSAHAIISGLGTAAERRAAVNAYIEEVYAKTERRITRKDIWKSARYQTPSEFERWQRCAANASKSSHERFVRILTDKPHLK